MQMANGQYVEDEFAGGAVDMTPKSTDLRRVAPDGGLYVALPGKDTDPGGSDARGVEASAQRFEIKCCRVIDPRDSKYIEFWDLVVTFCIFVTAFLCPYECIFVEPSGGIDGLYIANLCFDLIFVKDMVMQFFLVYQQVLPDGSSRWIRNQRRICFNYLTGWFIPDLVAVLPLDFVLVLYSAVGMQGDNAEKDARLIRLVRLVRLFKIGRIVKRWQFALGLSFGSIALGKFALMTSLACHWMSCIWGMMALQVTDDGTPTWLSALQESKGGSADQYTKLSNVYTISLYWATMTLTSLGYGDITAQNRGEYMFAIIVFGLSGLIWAFVIGSVCGIISSLDPDTVKFQTNMDALNLMMADHRISHEVRRRLRTYMHQSKNVQRQYSQRTVIEGLSPGLQGELTLMMTQAWLCNVWYLQGWETEALIQISRRMTVMVFAPGESMEFERTLFIIARGVAAKAGSILGKNATFGEDLFLTNSFLRQSSKARALTYLEALMLEVRWLDEVRKEFPNANARIRKAYCRLAVLRGFVLEAFQRVQRGGQGVGPRATDYFKKRCPSFSTWEAIREVALGNTPKSPVRRLSKYDAASLGTSKSQLTGPPDAGMKDALIALHRDLKENLAKINTRLTTLEGKVM